VLATLDPLSAMAATEDASLTGLLAALDADGPLGDLLTGSAAGTAEVAFVRRHRSRSTGVSTS
jgi:hypothetical protein